MLLAIDVGNTHTVLGRYSPNGEELYGPWRVRSERDRTGDEWSALLHGLFGAVNRTPDSYDIDGCVISSVVPPITAALRTMSRDLFGRDPLVVGPDLDLGIRVAVDNPQGVGTDRLVNAAAAYAQYGGPCIVVDLGTATTFDVVDRSGAFIGGAILPGPKTMAAALVRGTAQLPPVDLVPPPAAIGRNTVHALQSGLVLGYAALIEGLVARLRAELGGDPATIPVIATGGLASTLAAATAVFTEINPDLTLTGLQLIYARNVKRET